LPNYFRVAKASSGQNDTCIESTTFCLWN
jgi:hypothetical protein